MGFLNARVSFTRYKVYGGVELPLGEPHLERLRAFGIDRSGVSADGARFGWSGGDHLLDLELNLEKNVLDDCLHFACRLDIDKIPSALLKAYTEIELKSLSANNPTGRPSKAQRAEAKELAIARAESEASDGRYLRMRRFPLLWDAREAVLYAGTSTPAILERIQILFQRTFDLSLERISAGSLAQAYGFDSAGPAELSRDSSASLAGAIAWSDSTPTSRDTLGNEFLIWLWHEIQTGGGVIALPDGTQAELMLAKTLTLDCPRGETGRDQLTDEGPTRLPEAFRALQAGKLPRRAGVLLTRHDQAYDFTLQAETFDISAAGLPKTDEASRTEAAIARIASLRHLVESLDLVYQAFLQCRAGADWSREIGKIRSWLNTAA